MSMTDWAKREIEIACKKENPDWDGKSFDYGCSCYQSALKAYKSLCEDGHSGFSFSVTRNILEKLLYEIPLSPIEDTDDVWMEVSLGGKNGEREYQCKRRYSLFKRVKSDGSVSYNDVERVVCYEIGENNGFHSTWLSKLVDEMYPIKMPYMPSKNKFKVYCEYFLTDEKNGDYDMCRIDHLITPEGKEVVIHRFFDLRSDEPKEISSSEYFDLKEISISKG